MASELGIGDRVEVDLYRDGSSDEDGVGTAGRLVTKAGRVKEIDAFSIFVAFDDGDFQTCMPDPTAHTYPVVGWRRLGEGA